MTASKSEQFSEILRSWRARSRVSQLELALRCEVSQKHISFLESARVSPSRSMVFLICDALMIPINERNRLLLAAGFAPTYSGTGLNAGELGAVHRASETEARLECFLSTTRYWLWETNADHRFTFTTANAERHGFTIDHVRGKTRWDLASVSPDCDTYWRGHWSKLKARQPFEDFILRTIETNGDVLFRCVSGMPVFDAKGVFEGYRGTARDVTKQMQADPSRWKTELSIW